MKNKTDSETIRGYAKLFYSLIARGIWPKLQIFENEASQALQK